jgi:hypothetical protein
MSWFRTASEILLVYDLDLLIDHFADKAPRSAVVKQGRTI